MVPKLDTPLSTRLNNISFEGTMQGHFEWGNIAVPSQALSNEVVQAVINSLTRDRLKAYLKRVDGDEARAIKLYEWNTELSSALYETIQCFEVVIRNAICRAVEQHSTGQEWCRLTHKVRILDHPQRLLSLAWNGHSLV